MARNDGKEIEKKVGKALTGLLGRSAVMTRLYDTKSSAFFLPPSPADFMGMFKGGIPVLLECKSSSEHTTLSACSLKSFIKSTQYAYHKMWVDNGGVSMFVFHSVMTKEVEYWGGIDILRCYKGTTNLKNTSPVCITKDIVKDIQNALPSVVAKLNKCSIKEAL